MENAVDEILPVEAGLKTVGELLKSTREQLGMTLSSVAAKTRVPMRHLASIEQSQFGALPGQTYTIGFVRSYARAVDLDEIATVNACHCAPNSRAAGIRDIRRHFKITNQRTLHASHPKH